MRKLRHRGKVSNLPTVTQPENTGARIQTPVNWSPKLDYTMGKTISALFKRDGGGGFPGGPVVRTQCFHCQGPGFNPWSGKQNPASCMMKPKK